MPATHTWLLKDQRYRWVHVTPRVVSADPADRLPHSHLIHISLVTVSPSLPMCGKYRQGEYHPWPLTTRTIEDDDACGDCIKTVQRASHQAFFEATQMLFVRGEAELFPGTASFPPQLIEHMAELAALVQQHSLHLTQQQASLTQMHQIVQALAHRLVEAGIPLPDAMRAIMVAPSGTSTIETLFTYNQYQAWCVAYWGTGYIVRITGSQVMVHRTTCSNVSNQDAATYTPRWGALTEAAVWEHFLTARGCTDCHTGPPVRRQSGPTPILLHEATPEATEPS